jgi:hypothetical protein
MAIMNIVNMAIMANRRVPAVRAMQVGMVGMVRLGAGDHEILLLLHLRFRCHCLSAACSITLRTSRGTEASETA